MSLQSCGIQVVDDFTSRSVCEQVTVANTFFSRFIGLLRHHSLAETAGLWLVPSAGVHTLGMRFAIDVIALDKTMHVVTLHHNVRPWRLAAVHRSTHSVLELPCGRIKATGIELGDSLFTTDTGFTARTQRS